jgi:hypothetical protein
MLNEVSRRLHSAVSRALEGVSPLTRQSIAEATVPKPVRDFIDARLAHESERVAEEIKASRDPWVSENADVSRARTALSVAVSRSIQIPTSEREAVIRETVHTVARYLIRPARTLVEVIFESDGGEIDVDEAMERMAGLDAYGYFDDVLHHYFEEKNVEQVDRARLNSVLHRVDRQMTSDFSTDEWMEISAPLFDTLSFAPEYEDGVPADVLRAYFREKEAGRILERLEDLDGDENVSQQRLRRLLDKPAAPPPVVEEAPRAAERPKPPAKREVSSMPPAPAPSSDGPLPLWKQFQSGSHENKSPRSAPSDEPPGDPGAPLWQRFRSPSQEKQGSTRKSVTPEQRDLDRTEPERREHVRGEGPPPPRRREVSEARFERRPEEEERPGREVKQESPAPRQDASPPPERYTSLDGLESQVLGSRGAKNRKLFVRQIFGGDVDAYREALETISRSRSWSDASRYIAREVFMRHDVNIYDDAAVTFTDLVEERFAEQHST